MAGDRREHENKSSTFRTTLRALRGNLCPEGFCVFVTKQRTLPFWTGLFEPRSGSPPLRYGLPFISTLPSGAFWQVS